MKTHVTVIPSDGIISVDGEVLFLDGITSETFHALQWHDGAGHVEPGNGLPNEELSTDDYAVRVAPFVALWEEEKARLEQAAAEAGAARLAEYNSEAARFERLRAERDRRLSATDYLLMQDYPLDNTHKEAVRHYRQALRDLPSQEGAPWDGGGEETPWPLMPELASFVSLSYAKETPSGSDSDPYTFTSGIDVYSGKYYSYNNHLYLAKSDMTACVWPPDTEGLWQWELVS